MVSFEAVTMRAPSGLKEAEVTSRAWPRRTAISLAVAASQMRAVLSSDVTIPIDPAAWPLVISLPGPR